MFKNSVSCCEDLFAVYFNVVMMDLRRRLLLLLLLFSAQLICLVKGNVVFKVQHKFGGREQGRSALSAFRAHDLFRHGRMLGAVDFQLGGNGQPTDAALYYTKLSIGIPSNDYHIQVDTGSDILWVNCADCDKCPTKSDLKIAMKQYDLKASSTGKAVTCDQDFCSAMFNGGYSDCKVGASCDYAVTYGDGSRTEGYFVRDYIKLDEVTGNLQTSSMNGSIAFGCSSKQSGDLGSSSEAVDGIFGFGQANTSVLSQLASSGKVKKIFSHCLDGINGGGIFAIGQLVHPKVKSTHLVPNEAHYNVIMKAVEVGGESLDLPTDLFGTGSQGGTIIDSGTTLAYLPDEIYEPLMEKVMAQKPNLKTQIVEQQFKCFDYSGNVDNEFPVVTFQFDDSLSLTVYPHEYLFRISDDEWCIGWQNGGMQTKDGKEITLLGDLVLSNKVVLYDLENQTIGWTAYNCSSSIMVRDEKSRNSYTVGAHDISCASIILTRGNIISFILLIAFLLAFNE